MIISKTQVQNLLKVYEKNLITKNPIKTDSVTPVKKDAVNISEASKMKQKIMQAINQSPDIREDRVAELQKKYEAGNLDMKSDEIADKMIQRAIIDDLI